MRFYTFDTGLNTWPFSQQPDKTDPGVDPVRYLRVNSKNTKWMKVTSPVTIKYAVEDEAAKPAEPLDPMIIIRPGLRSIIAAGLPWALAGAALGALITWYLLNR